MESFQLPYYLLLYVFGDQQANWLVGLSTPRWRWGDTPLYLRLLGGAVKGVVNEWEMSYLVLVWGDGVFDKSGFGLKK